METTSAATLVPRALGGDLRALRALVDALAPVVERHVLRGLMRQRTRARGRDVRQEAEDMVQEVFAALFDDGGRAMRAFCPNRGLPFERFIGLLAERQVGAILRSGRRTPWREDSIDQELVETRPSNEASASSRFELRDFGEAVVERLLDELSPRGIQLFELLFVEERDVADIVRTLTVASDVVYAWRSRIIKRAKAIARELDETAALRTDETKELSA